jgi:DNA-binding NtrC family response regulator
MDIFEREKGEFHLLLTDVFLPHLGGLELLDQLLSRKPQLRVLLTSGYTDDKSQWLIIRERGFRFIPKPYALAHLLRAVSEAMEPS